MDQRLFGRLDESGMGTGYDVRKDRREGELRKAMGFLNKVGKKKIVLAELESGRGRATEKN